MEQRIMKTQLVDEYQGRNCSWDVMQQTLRRRGDP